MSLRDVIRSGSMPGTKAWLAGANDVEVVEEISRLDSDECAVAFRLLPKVRAAEIFELLDPVTQQDLLSGLRADRVTELFENMDPDDRVRLLDEMPASVATRMLAGLSRAEREMTAQLMGYPPDSAGRLMTPEYVSLRAAMTAGEALRKIRARAVPKQDLHVLPVTDNHRHLEGVVDLVDVVIADPDQRVADIMDNAPLDVNAYADREVAARLVQEADLVALPVVDSEDRLVGVITFDDAMAVLELEDTEDITRGGGSEPIERPYLTASAFLLARKRAMWLLVLIATASLTVNILEFFEDTLSTVVTLALFIPLLIATGGNAGAQAATVVVRAFAVGEVKFSDLPRIVWREARTGIMLGLLLAVVAFPIVAIVFGPDYAWIVSLSLVAICTWASFVGGGLPLLAGRFGIDPAVVSAPFVTTLVDSTGLIIYFLIAQAILGV